MLTCHCLPACLPACLQAATASSPKDSLQLPARIITAVLGSGNPVAEVLCAHSAWRLAAKLAGLHFPIPSHGSTARELGLLVWTSKLTRHLLLLPPLTPPQELLRLAEGNLSLGAKSERQERERRLAAELAAKLVGGFCWWLAGCLAGF